MSFCIGISNFVLFFAQRRFQSEGGIGARKFINTSSMRCIVCARCVFTHDLYNMSYLSYFSNCTDKINHYLYLLSPIFHLLGPLSQKQLNLPADQFNPQSQKYLEQEVSQISFEKARTRARRHNSTRGIRIQHYFPAQFLINFFRNYTLVNIYGK